jgi:elongation factor G
MRTCSWKYLEGEPISEEELRAALRAATIAGKLVPVLCGTALRNKGCSRCWTPWWTICRRPWIFHRAGGQSPDRSGGDRPADPSAPARRPGIQDPADPYVGRLAATCARLFGRSAERAVPCRTRPGPQRAHRPPGAVYANRAKRWMSCGRRHRGVVGVQEDLHRRDPVRPGRADRAGAIEFPEPVISVAIEPKTQADQDKLAEALQRLAEEDPTFRVQGGRGDRPDAHQRHGELHLEVLVDRMQREFRRAGARGPPRWRTGRRSPASAQVETRFMRQTGGRGQYAHVIAGGGSRPKGKGNSLSRQGDRGSMRCPRSSSR